MPMRIASTGLNTGSAGRALQGSQMTGDDRGLMLEYDPARLGMWSRDGTIKAVSISNSGTENIRKRVYDSGTFALSGINFNGTSVVDYRAKDLTVLFAAVDSQDTTIQWQNIINMFSGKNGGQSGGRVNAAAGYGDFRCPTTGYNTRTSGVNYFAFTIPAIVPAISAIRCAKNGVVQAGVQSFVSGTPYGLSSSTIGTNFQLQAGSVGGIIKIWDRLLSDVELRRQTINPYTSTVTYTESVKYITQTNTFRPLILSYNTAFKVGGYVSTNSGSSWSLSPGTSLTKSLSSNFSIYYEMIVAAGSLWSIKRTGDRNPFLKPKHGDFYARVVLPNMIRLDRYECVLPNADTTKFRFSGGVGTVFSINRTL